MTYKNLPQHYLTAQLYLKFLLITEHEVPFMNTGKATIPETQKLKKILLRSLERRWLRFGDQMEMTLKRLSTQSAP